MATCADISLVLVDAFSLALASMSSVTGSQRSGFSTRGPAFAPQLSSASTSRFLAHSALLSRLTVTSQARAWPGRDSLHNLAGRLVTA